MRSYASSVSYGRGSEPVPGWGEGVPDRLGAGPLGPSRNHYLLVGRHDHDFVVFHVESDIRSTHVVDHDGVGPLAGQLPPGALDGALALLGGAPDQQPPVPAHGAQLLQDVRRRFELDRPAGTVLRPLA